MWWEFAVMLCCELVLFSGVLFQQIKQIRNPFTNYDENGNALEEETCMEQLAKRKRNPGITTASMPTMPPPHDAPPAGEIDAKRSK